MFVTHVRSRNSTLAGGTVSDKKFVTTLRQASSSAAITGGEKLRPLDQKPGLWIGNRYIRGRGRNGSSIPGEF